MRAMVVGIPNTGKSSIINGLLRRTAAKTEDKAGVTRSLQWFRVQPKLEVMDTPGILVPKIATPEAQWQLALTGALPRERFDAEDVVEHFVAWAREHRPQADVPDLETFARGRGFARRGGEVDLHNAAGAYLKDFNDGKFGRITFERAEPRLMPISRSSAPQEAQRRPSANAGGSTGCTRSRSAPAHRATCSSAGSTRSGAARSPARSSPRASSPTARCGCAV